MNKFRLNINGKEVTGVAGQTILEVARENDIFIPTLCYDERTKIYGSCGSELLVLAILCNRTSSHFGFSI